MSNQTSINDSYVGSIVGYNDGGIIKNCYNTNTVKADSYNVGGIAGCNADGGVIENCYNAGGVSAQMHAGGIAGYTRNHGVIQNCYNTGVVSSSVGDAGGIRGGYEWTHTITNCYYYDEVNLKTDVGIPLGMEELKQQNSYAGFDFDAVWTMGGSNGYPFPTLQGITPPEQEENTTDFAGGAGRLENPYQISAPQHLDNVRNYPAAFFIQTTDIDMTAATAEGGLFYHEGAGWEPIREFDGNYNGSGCRIIGLTSKQEWYSGFVEENSGIIRNLGMEQGTVTSENSHIGGFVGYNQGIIENCYNTSTVTDLNIKTTPPNYAGGIAGENSLHGIIKNCYNRGTISGNAPGGIVGRNWSGTIENCRNMGTVTSVHLLAGGIAGDNGGLITRCYNEGNVSLNTSSKYDVFAAGGIAGTVSGIKAAITDCYNTGSVSLTASPGETAYAGGIAGAINEADISACYNIGGVSASSDDTGGIVGAITSRFGTVTNCYYYNDPTLQTADGTPLSTAELKQPESYIGFDFDTVWAINPDSNDGYPYLRAELTHDWGEWNIIKQPTQTETGMAERVCKNDSSHKEQKELPVLTDTSVWTKGDYQAPTCDADGYQKYTSEYGEVTETIPATDHSWDAWSITKQPTQTETGTAERVCKNDSSHKEQKELPVLTDTTVWGKGEYKAPTCEADGYQKYTSEYGEVTETIPATDHSWGAWTITKQPTQTETGTAERICQNDNSHKDTVTLPVLTDTTTWTKGEYQAPTCEADGYQKYTSEYGEVTETSPATDHNWGAWSITKQPTQTETGTAERICQNDNSHKDTVTLPVLTDTATWTKGEYQAPTCETDGYQKYTSEYGEVTETIPATDHSWGAWTITKQPTQTETGAAERICQNDGNHKDTVILPVLTDTSVWTKGERVEPTCTADGSQAYTSDYGTVTETLPATDHTFEWVIDRPATTEAPGIQHEECTKCHEKRNENTEIPQLPVESYVIHYDANGGSGTMPDGAAPKDKEFTLPENAFTPPEGKQFQCWAIGSIDGTQIQPGTGFTFTENTTVYAVWENIGFTVTFDKNGGSSVSAETMVTNPDGKLSELPTATRSGSYRFKGWYTEKTGGTEITKETVFTEDTTVYAQWAYTGGGSSGGGGGGGSVTRYTVTFDTQGGSEIDSIRVIRNNTVTKPEDPAREGYTFEGWFTDQECSEAYDFDTKVTKNITLYAKWAEEQPEEPTEPTEPENPDEWENPFDDVDGDDWFYDDVKTAYENGWFTGVTDTAFAPDEAITRGMMVTVLYRAENEPATADKSKFADVAPDAYYTKAVIWAENNGIVKGYSEVEFAPDKLISREEMAAIMHRYAGYKGADTSVSGDLTKFADQAQIADWARENVAWAVGYGLLSGKDNNQLDPQGHTTRAETAAILNRFLEK